MEALGGEPSPFMVGSRQQIVYPPPTTRSSPVIELEASEAKNITAPTISIGFANLCKGIIYFHNSANSGFSFRRFSTREVIV